MKAWYLKFLRPIFKSKSAGDETAPKDPAASSQTGLPYYAHAGYVAYQLYVGE